MSPSVQVCGGAVEKDPKVFMCDTCDEVVASIAHKRPPKNTDEDDAHKGVEVPPPYTQHTSSRRTRSRQNPRGARNHRGGGSRAAGQNVVPASTHCASQRTKAKAPLKLPPSPSVSTKRLAKEDSAASLPPLGRQSKRRSWCLGSLRCRSSLLLLRIAAIGGRGRGRVGGVIVALLLLLLLLFSYRILSSKIKNQPSNQQG